MFILRYECLESLKMEFSTSTLTKEEETEMKSMFKTYDVDANGTLELDELQKMFANFNVIALKEDLKAFFEKVIIVLVTMTTTTVTMTTPLFKL